MGGRHSRHAADPEAQLLQPQQEELTGPVRELVDQLKYIYRVGEEEGWTQANIELQENALVEEFKAQQPGVIKKARASHSYRCGRTKLNARASNRHFD
jgi:hypothetical protein